MFQVFINYFTSIQNETLKGVILSSFLIPFIFYSTTRIRYWFISLFPINQLYTGYRKSKTDILIFISQFSAVNNQNQLIPDQSYIAHFPRPLPSDINNLGLENYGNINPLWSQSDGQCSAEIFNILGKINKNKSFKIADTIKDWNKHTNPIFTIGFNPKTKDLLNCCTPIYFELINDNSSLSINEIPSVLGSIYPNDAGILQKTFITNTNIPVFILAGLGTTGTEAAGKVLNQNSAAFGKLYGNKPFCVLFKTNITMGSSYYELKSIYPKPKLSRLFIYPITFLKWYNKKYFL
jgi:hypothetical protein